jgi:hypothetical protein
LFIKKKSDNEEFGKKINKFNKKIKKENIEEGEGGGRNNNIF